MVSSEPDPALKTWRSLRASVEGRAGKTPWQQWQSLLLTRFPWGGSSACPQKLDWGSSSVERGNDN